MNVGINFPVIDHVIASAERAALAISSAWAPGMLRLARRAVNAPIAAGAPRTLLIDGAQLEEEFAYLRFARGSKKTVALAIGGPIVDRLPPGVADLAISTFAIQWEAHDRTNLMPVTLESDLADLKRGFFAADALVCACLDLTAPAAGRLLVAARPHTWL